MSNVLEITHGPSKMDLMLAMFDRKQKGLLTPRSVVFELFSDKTGRTSIEVTLQGVEILSEPNEEWMLTLLGYKKVWYQAMYSSNTRNGKLHSEYIRG